MNLTKLAQALRDIADAIDDDPIAFVDGDITPVAQDAPAAEAPLSKEQTKKAEKTITAKALRTKLSKASKEHGTQVARNLLGGSKVVDMTAQERNQLLIKLESL